ncbi:unnamed protein product, partial [Mycena citricolor]
ESPSSTNVRFDQTIAHETYPNRAQYNQQDNGAEAVADVGPENPEVDGDQASVIRHGEQQCRVAEHNNDEGATIDYEFYKLINDAPRDVTRGKLNEKQRSKSIAMTGSRKEPRDPPKGQGKPKEEKGKDKTEEQSSQTAYKDKGKQNLPTAGGKGSVKKS